VASASAPPPIDLADLGRGPWGTFLHGPSRAVLQRCAYALALASDPRPTWIEICERGTAPDTEGPASLGWIPDDHLFFVHPTDARPENGIANLALTGLVRSDEPTAVLAEITDFLRLPSIVQDAMSRLPGGPERSAFVVANTDKVRSYYPSEAGGIRPIVDAMVRANALPIFAAVGPPGAGRWAFDFVLEVRAPDLARWRQGTLVCEQAPTGTSLPIGVPVPLPTVPGLAGPLDRARN